MAGLRARPALHTPYARLTRRWGRSALEGHMWEGSWFELYGHLDREAVGKIRRELATSFPDNPDVREALIQRELDKRRQAPGPGATAGDGAVGTRATVRDEVRRWRARHGMLDAAPSDHTCTPRCSLDQLSVSVFICRSSGRVHRCGAHCTLAENNNQGEMVSRVAVSHYGTSRLRRRRHWLRPPSPRRCAR